MMLCMVARLLKTCGTKLHDACGKSIVQEGLNANT